MLLVTKNEIQALIAALTPLRISIDERRGRSVTLGRPELELVPSQGLRLRGDAPFIAGDISLADLYLAPVAFYVSVTPDKDAVFAVDGFADWWTRIQARPSFAATALSLG